MSRTGRISSKAGKVAKTAKSTARSTVSKSRTTTVWKKTAATGRMVVSATGRKKAAPTSPTKKTPPQSGIRKSSVTGTVERVKKRQPTSVEQAIAEGVTTQKQNGVTVAADTDVLRIARAVAEHRKGLMDRLAK